ncbi:MAG: DUF3558 family protein [Acidimicrobiia bacterium]
MRLRILTAITVVLLASCGGEAATTTVASPGADTSVAESETAPSTTAAIETTTTTGAAAGAEDPCALVTAEVVASTFGAASATGEAGVARNCHFTIDGGVAPSVEVFHYGSSANWDGVKEGYVDNRGGVTAVEVGEEAYQPNDVGPYELVVRSGDVVFAVAVQQGQGGPEVEAAILDLAAAIAGG